MADVKDKISEKGGKKNESMKGKVISYCFIAICVAVLIHGSVNLFKVLNNYRIADELYSDTVDEFVSMSDDAAGEQMIADGSADSQGGDQSSAAQSVTVQSEENAKQSNSKRPGSVNFKKLREINPDVIGWIYIGGANVNYPIVEGKNNDYYLHRDYRKKNLFAGSIFADYRNSRDFSDWNTVIYGHNMNNGSMFGRLSRLSKKSVYSSDPYIWIYTPQGTYCYEISAVFQTDSGSYVYTIFKKYGKDYANWVKKINRHTLPGLNKLPSDEGSRCITLSTCTGRTNKRTVVIAKLAGQQ